MTQPIYWPYDEVRLQPGPDQQVQVQSPWLNLTVAVEDPEGLVPGLADALNQQQLGPEMLGNVNWFFRSLNAYPFCYILPRQQWASERDQHQLQSSPLASSTPGALLNAALSGRGHDDELKQVTNKPRLQGEWQWDQDTACDFAKSAEGIDPYALFSVARRFHLLASLEDNKTAELYEKVKGLKDDDQAAFDRAAAMMVRQNHYVTQRCNDALSPALATAQNAKAEVAEFIQEEYGHDRILDVAVKAMGQNAESIPVAPEAKILMDCLTYTGERNFLAFAMVVDFFERSAYQESDPLAQVLKAGGQTVAAKQIDRHMDINDAGEHENVALGFLKLMGPVDEAYAREALQLAEVTTHVMNMIASGVEAMLNESP